MKNAKELMLEYAAFSFKDPKTAAEMFAEDGAFELPYLATFGLPTQYRGRDAIAAFSNLYSTSIPVSNSRIPRC
jgi:hypothetical protein